jgi:fluoride ion exporter CrcB/FEX
MEQEQAGIGPPLALETDEAPIWSAADPKGPGWYPAPTNPSDQTYWDGQNWTARRRWTGARGWLVAGDGPDEVTSQSAHPYGSLRSRSKATGFTFNVGLLLLLVCGVALMYGSVGDWVHVNGNVGAANFHVSLNGIDPGISTLIGVNGWATFIGGILIVIFAGFEMTSEELQLGILTTVIAAATTIFATYDMFRVVQKISQVPTSALADVSVGWGLICILAAAALATLIAIVRLAQH